MLNSKLLERSREEERREEEERKEIDHLKETFLGDSLLVTSNHQIKFLAENLRLKFGEAIVAKLEFRGSRDGWTYELFANAVQNKGPALYLVKTTKGIVCGGFLNISYQKQGGWMQDPDSFLFSLKTLKKYHI